MNRTQVLEAIVANRLEHLRAPLRDLLRPAIRVTVSASKRKRALGSSRFGGLPDLPPRSKWPTVDGIPLMFAGQVALKDVVRFKAAQALPKHGLLSFFFDGMLTGYDRGETPDRCRVIHTETTEALMRLPVPASVPTRFEVYPEVAPVFGSSWTLPEFEEIDGAEFPTIPPIVPLLRSIRDQKRYQKLRRTVRGKHLGSKLFGYPDGVQGGEIRFGAVMKHDKEERFRYEDGEITHVEQLVTEMGDLCLLFQSAMGVTWGGMGVVYFWIRRQDLEKARFDRVFAELQST